MPRRSQITLTARTVAEARAEGRDLIVWDRELPGFGLRVYASGSKTYLAQARGGDRVVRVSLGTHREMSPREARREAAKMIERIRRGEDAAADRRSGETTLAELAERFWREHVGPNCRAGTARYYRGLLRHHILPAFGPMSLSRIGRKEVGGLHHGLRHFPATANGAIKLLSKLFTLAEYWRLVPPGRNPCRSVNKYKLRRRERFLTPDEYRRLGRALDATEVRPAPWPHAVAAVRLLLVTGCRRGEILGLRWNDVDPAAGRLRLRETKSGPRMVPLTTTLHSVLEAIPRIQGNPWVIAGRRAGVPIRSLTHYWHRIRHRAGLDDVRLHDLRHSYASRALATGENLLMIGRLLGHRRLQSTDRYAHLPRQAEKRAVARVGDSIGAHIA